MISVIGLWGVIALILSCLLLSWRFDWVHC